MISKERFDDPEAVFRAAMAATAVEIWSAMPGYIVAFDASKITATIQLGVKNKIRLPDGATQRSNMPLLTDVPVTFPRGGGCTLTFPVKADDECLVVFASRSTDSWRQGGGVQSPVDERMHDLSDGFAILGPMSQAKKISGVSETTAQLRSDDGEAYIEIDPLGHILNAVAPGGFNVTGPFNVIGPATFSETVTAVGDVVGAGVSLQRHPTSGVTSGDEESGPPVPG